jgi:ABC-type multidrug transport system fused ATPase/permease subunit
MAHAEILLKKYLHISCLFQITFQMMSVVPLLVMSAILYGRYTKKLSKAYQDALASAADIGTENISNARIMKSFGAEKLANLQYRHQVDNSFAIGAKRALGYGLFVGGLGTMANFAIIVVIYYGATLVLSGDLTVGALTSFVLYTILIAVGMGLLGSLYSTLPRILFYISAGNYLLL